ncbi:hypothetical protein ABHI18_010810, partial [Aspergillus niger]
AAAVALDHNRQITGSRQISIGSMEHWSAYAAELMAIYYAMGLVFQLAQKKHATTTNQGPATILSDSQRIIKAIHQSAAERKARGIPLRLQWVPGHCGDPGNETADRLAKEAMASAIAEKAFIRNKIKKEWEQEWKTSKNGGHLRRMDGPLPAYRICRLYGSLTRNRAYLLAFEGHKLSIRQDEAVPGIMLVTIKVHLS